MKHRAKVVLVRIIKFSLNAQICIKLHFNDNVIYFAATEILLPHTDFNFEFFFFLFFLQHNKMKVKRAPAVSQV